MSIIEDAAQLVKYNSIQGNKMNDIDVVYTMWGNLHKTEGMEVGQVSFYDIVLDQCKGTRIGKILLFLICIL